MPRYKAYVEANVLDEAKARIHHIYDLFDEVAVAFSGGKDSLATLHLVHEVAQERGIPRVRAVFRDEELIHASVVEFVRQQMLDLPWLDLEWWCIPLESVRYVLGETIPITFWDQDRGPDRWARPMPEWALTADDLGLPAGVKVDQHTADALIARNMRGSVCVLTGVRASESILRWRACVNKLNENYIVASSSKRVSLGRPIFDWLDNDVFRYFYDRGLQYCPIYDAQLWGDASPRVSTALNPQASKVLHQLHYYDPELYARAVEVFPDTATQRRYWSEYDVQALMEKHAKSWETLEAWVRAHYKDPEAQGATLKELRAVKVRAKVTPDSYPLDHVFKSLLRQSGRRTIQPLTASAREQE